MTGIGGLLVVDEHSELQTKLRDISSAISHRGYPENHFFNAIDFGGVSSNFKEEINSSNRIGLSIMKGQEHLSSSATHEGTSLFLDSNLPDSISSEMQNGCAADFDRVVSGGQPSLLRHLFGTVAIYVNGNGLWIFRSVDGTKPIFYSNDNNMVAFSTERKGLWNAGFIQTNRVEPGYVLEVDWAGNVCHSKLTNRYQDLNLNGVFKSEILSQLETSLEKSFERIESQDCAVLFSGGIDSSLAAFMAARAANDVILVTAKAEGSHDEEAASQAANMLEMEHVEVHMNARTVWNILPRVIYSIESTDKMDIEIALPFFLSMMKASEMGYDVAVSGQGPDELFAGYHRYLQMYDPEHPEKLDNEMRNDISSTYRRNIERDELAIANAGGRAFFPYLCTNFVELGLATPVSYKISLGDEPSRKRILREAALSMGLPHELASAPKKATQYSSGTADLLIEATRNNVPELSNLGKSKVSRRIQEVVDIIGQKIGIPGVTKKRSKLDINEAAVTTFLENIERKKQVFHSGLE